MSRERVVIGIEKLLEQEPGDKSWINDDVHARVISVEAKDKSQGAGKIYKIELGSDTSSARVMMTMFSAPPRGCVRGALVALIGTGNRLKDYQGTPEISVGKNGEVHVIADAPAARKEPPAQRAPADDSRGGGHPPAEPPADAPPAGSRPLGIEGATVGMAYNQACEFQRWACEDPSDMERRLALLRDPNFWLTIRQTISAGVRLSNSVKAGNLAPPLSAPRVVPETPPPEPATPPPKPAEPPRESTPPPQTPPPANRKPPAPAVDDEDVPF